MMLPPSLWQLAQYFANTSLAETLLMFAVIAIADTASV